MIAEVLQHVLCGGFVEVVDTGEEWLQSFGVTAHLHFCYESFTCLSYVEFVFG